MNGLQSINIEITSRCNKKCDMCGRRKLEREHPELAKWGDMPFEMLERIAGQIPPGVFIQLHNNGEPLLYPRFADALKLFTGHYVGLDTNGKLLMAQQEAIRAYLSSITISVIPDDPEGDEQIDIAWNFLQFEYRPLVVFRLLGNIDHERYRTISQWQDEYPKVLMAERILHSPDGSFDYEKDVTIPETGICAEMLHKLAIDRFGGIYPCVRFDPEKKNLLGNIDDPIPNNEPRVCRYVKGKPEYDRLWTFWHSKTRKQWIQHHIDGRRDLVPLCKDCDFWGIPRG